MAGLRNVRRVFFRHDLQAQAQRRIPVKHLTSNPLKQFLSHTKCKTKKSGTLLVVNFKSNLHHVKQSFKRC